MIGAKAVSFIVSSNPERCPRRVAGCGLEV
jgi:hypothetical protein